MRSIYLSRDGAKVEVTPHVYGILSVFKICFPPDHEFVLGGKTIKPKDYSFTPPPEQTKLLEVKQEEYKKIQNMG